MSRRSPSLAGTARRRGFTFLEVLLVIGIIGLMALCLIGFVLSRHSVPLIPPTATPAPAQATSVPIPTPPAPSSPATPAPPQ